MSKLLKLMLLSAVLAIAGTVNYSYDAVGNRLSSLGVNPYSYNTSNQLTGGWPPSPHNAAFCC